MGVFLRFTDGTTTVDLSASPATVLFYNPGVPDKEIVRLPSWGNRGTPVAGVGDQNVSDEAEIAFGLGSNDTARANAAALSLLFRQAEQCAARRSAPLVYVEFRPENTESWYRSPVYSGDVEWSEDALWWQKRGYCMAGTVRFERSPWWEGPESEVPLDNAHGSGTGGRLIYNRQDGTASNYVQFSGLGGDLPAACRLEFYNSTAGDNLYNVWVGHNIWSDPANFPHVIECEGGVLGSLVGGSQHSNGQARALSWSGTSENVILRLTLTAEQLDACRGAQVHLLARVEGVVQQMFLRPQLRLFASRIWDGSPVRLQPFGETADLGTMPLPPGLVGEVSGYPLELWIIGQGETEATYSLTMDNIQMFPVDGWKVYRPTGYGLWNGATLVDEGFKGLTWVYSGQKSPHYVAEGAPLMLWPSRTQRLYFRYDNIYGRAPVGASASVRLYYRPRRRTL